MMESAENRSRHDSHALGELMADNQGSRQPRGWLWEARAEARMRAAVIMDSPGAQHPPQMLFPDGNQEVQTLSP